MKYFISTLITIFCIIGFYNHSYAAIDISNMPGVENITKQSNGVNNTGVDPVTAINQTGEKILITIKTIVAGLLVIFIVYAGAQMVMSMGSDEDQLSSAKRQLWYSVIAFVFINIPGAIFNSFNSTSQENIDAGSGYTSWFSTPSTSDSGNIFINGYNLGNTLSGDIIGFIQIIISVLAIAVILIASLKILTSRGKEESISEAKDKILWSIVSLLLVGFIESWKYFVYKGDIDDGTNLFETLIGLVTFFAGPVAIAFITYAGYLFITANGEEDKINKAKSIIINVLLATVILLAGYTFLLDLITL